MPQKVISTGAAPAAIGPYSQAIQAASGELLYLSGQIPLDPATGQLVTGDIKTQAAQVLRNIKAVLDAAGYSPGHVVKSTIFLTNLAHFADVNTLYGEFFGDHKPARSTVQVAALPRGAEVEIECVAIR